MKSPRTTHEFRIDPFGLDIAINTTWEATDEEFTKMARMCFGLPIDGLRPCGTFLKSCALSRIQE